MRQSTKLPAEVKALLSKMVDENGQTLNDKSTPYNQYCEPHGFSYNAAMIFRDAAETGGEVRIFGVLKGHKWPVRFAYIGEDEKLHANHVDTILVLDTTEQSYTAAIEEFNVKFVEHGRIIDFVNLDEVGELA